MHGFGFGSGFFSVGFIPLGTVFLILVKGVLCGIEGCVEILYRCKSVLAGENDLVIAIGGSVMLIMIGVGIYMLVHTCVLWRGFKKLLSIEEVDYYCWWECLNSLVNFSKPFYLTLRRTRSIIA